LPVNFAYAVTPIVAANQLINNNLLTWNGATGPTISLFTTADAKYLPIDRYDH